MASSAKSSGIKKSGNCLVPFLIALVILLVALGAGGYVLYDKVRPMLAGTPLAELADKAVGGTMLALVSESDLADISDPLVRKHLLKQYNTRKYKVISTSSGLGDGRTEMTFDMRSMTDFRMRVKQVMEGKDASDMITIGDTTYVKDFSDGSWWMQKAKKADDAVSSQEGQADFSADSLKEEVMKKTSVTYTSLGEEACGGLTCHKYEELLGEDGGKRTFWFDTKDLLLRKEEHGYGEFSSQSEYSYEDVKVEAPSPTKPVPEGKSIYEMSAQSMMQGTAPAAGGSAAGGGSSAGYSGDSMPSQEQIDQMMQQWGGSEESAPADEPTE